MILLGYLGGLAGLGISRVAGFSSEDQFFVGLVTGIVAIMVAAAVVRPKYPVVSLQPWNAVRNFVGLAAATALTTVARQLDSDLWPVFAIAIVFPILLLWALVVTSRPRP